MDTQDHVRSVTAYQQFLRDLDLLGRELAPDEVESIAWALRMTAYGYIATERFVRLVEAVKKASASEIDQILRSWGVRR